MNATMMNALKDQARTAGASDLVETVNDRLAAVFETWLHNQAIAEVTDEEEHALRLAFEEGYGICMHGHQPLWQRVETLALQVRKLDRLVYRLDQKQGKDPAVA